jgi:hypothetical protein
MNDYNFNIKLKVIKHYSNNACRCVSCGFDDIRALELDHILDNGKEHRKKVRKWGQNFYHYLIKTNFKDDKSYPMQVLCSNCNSIKEYNRRKN